MLCMARSEPAKPTPFDKFEAFVKKIVNVPKKEIDQAELRKRKEQEAREADRAK